VGLYLFDRIIHAGNRGYFKTVFHQDTGQRQPNSSFVVHKQYAPTQQIISHGLPFFAGTKEKSKGRDCRSLNKGKLARGKYSLGHVLQGTVYPVLNRQKHRVHIA
jgi:hypothetical protein